MNQVIKDAKKVMEFQPKMEQLFKEANTFSKSHQTLEKENNNLQREVNVLTTINQNLTKENHHLKDFLKAILEVIKNFFRELLQIGSEPVKETITSEVKKIYHTDFFSTKDVFEISKGIDKEDELFDYAEIPNYYKIRNKKSSNKGSDLCL
ncbi:MAG: hypothetical protein ACI4XM_07925 [Candidatus Coprovivens sp.]